MEIMNLDQNEISYIMTFNEKYWLFTAYNVYTWTTEDVGLWLESLSLGEYRDSFIGHEIRGTELLTLDKGDIQVSTIIGSQEV